MIMLMSADVWWRWCVMKVMCDEGDVWWRWCACDADVRNVQSDHAASHIGKAQGLVTLVRAVHYHARRNRVYLPRDLMIKVVKMSHSVG